ncbi:TonB-system energizer ExbB [Helicobacter burdigaliensis]|uniref:TonB-system energizer ExbB n=1 Tax=Helicobacter burdigaliensis TaxID=2315334 RepID=UPI000EF74EF2|nr:TonB-system energizer ExbB [Helicobacter burdigaliensis]
MLDLSLKESVEYGVMGVLLLMSVVALWASIERLLFYRYIKLVLYENKTELEIDLSKNLTIIATIGSNAPYVGLLGTVFGIIIAFVQMGQSGLVDSASIMSGLALALQATAGGLIVAIPSIIFYNLLMRKSEVLVAKWEILQEKKQDKNFSLKDLEEGRR